MSERVSHRLLLLLAALLPTTTALSIPPTLVAAAAKPPLAVITSYAAANYNLQQFALATNVAAELANGVVYITPLRNFVIKALFGIGAQDFFSPISGALMYLGGLHAAVAVQCLLAFLGLRHARETLAFMCVLHAFQAAVGLFRAVKTRNAGKLSDDMENELDAFMGAGGGPAAGAVVLGLLSACGLGPTLWL